MERYVDVLRDLVLIVKVHREGESIYDLLRMEEDTVIPRKVHEGQELGVASVVDVSASSTALNQQITSAPPKISPEVLLINTSLIEDTANWSITKESTSSCSIQSLNTTNTHSLLRISDSTNRHVRLCIPSNSTFPRKQTSPRSSRLLP
jgi:hypothetical protein